MKKLTSLAASAVLAFSLTACGGDDGDQPADSGKAPDSAASNAGGGDGDYAFGTDRDQMATAIEAAFKSKDGSVDWDGDTLVLSLDGDADGPGAGISECLVLDQLINEGDSAVIKFPNGTVSCDEALP